MVAYLQRDVVPAGQVLADNCQRGLLNVPDTFVNIIDGRVAFPLARGFVSENEARTKEDETPEVLKKNDCRHTHTQKKIARSGMKERCYGTSFFTI